MDRTIRLKRLKFRAWHRGTKEADLLIGGFCDRHAATWNDDALDWFETLMDEQDVDIMAWAMDRVRPPERFEGEWMEALRRLDYVPIA